MCLVALAWNAHPQHRAVVVANRDEFHSRAAEPVATWHDAPHLIGGRDRQAGGTWFAIDQRRRFGLITNYRERLRPRRSAPTRGRLIPDYLGGEQSAGQFFASMEEDSTGYAGFNLLLADEQSLWYASNRLDHFARPLEPGVHGLSNHTLDTPWPKLARLRDTLTIWADAGEPDTTPLWEALADRRRADPTLLPETGVGPEWEHILSAPFVLHPEYGTRCSTVLLLGHDGRIDLEERSFDPAGRETGRVHRRFAPGEWAPAAH